MPIEKIFNFVVERIDEKFNIIELSRNLYLEETRQISLGESYSVYFTKTHYDKSYFYSAELEGFVRLGAKNLAVGEIIEVIPVSTSSYEFEIS